MAALRVIAGGYADPAEVSDAEAAVLARAFRDMTDWINGLPTESKWRWSFIRARQSLEQELTEKFHPPRP